MTKSILFRYKLKGKGIVNYDSSEQKFIHNKYKTDLRYSNNNVSYAKKHFYKNEDNELDWDIIISSNCLRHNIFIKDAYSQSQTLQKSDELLYHNISSISSLLRGYTHVNSNSGIKRKSPITITDAVQTNNSKSTLETMSKSGNKDSGKVGTDGNMIASDTFFSKETIGDIEYTGEGQIDLMQLCFLPCSQEFDRYGFNPDLINLYKKYFNFWTNAIGIKDDIEIKDYTIKNSHVRISEKGILFSNETINILVKEFFIRMLEFNIKKAGAFANLSELEYKIVNDPLRDTFYSDDNWIKITNKSDIDNISFNVHEFYEVASEELIALTNEAIELFNKKDLQTRLDKQAAQKKPKKGATPVNPEIIPDVE